MADYQALQAEDDGFLIQLKEWVLISHLETLGLEECKTLGECVEKLIADSQTSTDNGASLPIYIPIYDDNGTLQAFDGRPVWAGKHIDVPLYGDLATGKVEELIKGKNSLFGSLADDFMEYSPAFRVALLVHHICQMVLLSPLVAEAFVLGRYEELDINDEHFTKFGVPTTELFQVSQNEGLRNVWSCAQPGQFMSRHKIESPVIGWTVQLRGGKVKRDTILAAWNEIQDILNQPVELNFTIGGKKMKHLEPDKSVKVRRRYGDPDVALMCDWVDETLSNGTFPMHGKQKSWKEAVAQFAKLNPRLATRWTAESMRKAYQHHKS